MSHVQPAQTELAHEPDLRSPVAVMIGLATLAAMVLASGLVVRLLISDTHPSLPNGHGVIHTPAQHDWGPAGVEQLHALRARASRHLGRYQWTDAQHTAVRIPIERAMELLSRPKGESGAP